MRDMNEQMNKRITEEFFTMTNKRNEKKIKDYVDKRIAELTERCQTVKDFCQVSCDEVKSEQLKVQGANETKFGEILGVMTKRVTADQVADKIATSEY